MFRKSFTSSLAVAAALMVSSPTSAATLLLTPLALDIAPAQTLGFIWTADGLITSPAPGQFAATATAQFDQFGTAEFAVVGTASPAVGDVTPVVGEFVFDFGEHSFMGTFAGENFPRDPATQLSLFTRTFTILGGTGIFNGSSGAMTGAGSSLFTPGATPPVSFSVAGQGVMSVPFASPVPEPATWLMLLIGFAGIGAALRRRSGGYPHVGAAPTTACSNAEFERGQVATAS